VPTGIEISPVKLQKLEAASRLGSKILNERLMQAGAPARMQKRLKLSRTAPKPCM
jgi:hypothetical protein